MGPLDIHPKRALLLDVLWLSNGSPNGHYLHIGRVSTGCLMVIKLVHCNGRLIDLPNFPIFRGARLKTNNLWKIKCQQLTSFVYCYILACPIFATPLVCGAGQKLRSKQPLIPERAVIREQQKDKGKLFRNLVKDCEENWEDHSSPQAVLPGSF